MHARGTAPADDIQHQPRIRDAARRTRAGCLPPPIPRRWTRDLPPRSTASRSAIHNLSERTDDRSLNALRQEIEQVKGALDSLAREDTVRSSDRRWDDFDRRWSAFESRVDARQNARDPEIATCRSDCSRSAKRSATCRNRCRCARSRKRSARLRRSRPLRPPAGAPGAGNLPPDRAAPRRDFARHRRIERVKRTHSGSGAVPAHRSADFVAGAADRRDRRGSPDRRGDRPIIALTHRVDELAAQGSLPEQAIERLSRQVYCHRREDRQTPFASEREAILRDMNQRFDVLSAMIERRQGDAIEHGNMMFRDLERRLDEVASRIDQRASASGRTRF